MLIDQLPTRIFCPPHLGQAQRAQAILSGLLRRSYACLSRPISVTGSVGRTQTARPLTSCRLIDPIVKSPSCKGESQASFSAEICLEKSSATRHF
jgi:hypothetical protein